MIQGRHTLGEGRELYVCAAWLSEQLAWLAWDLGGRTAAKAYALDCWHHADQAGHDELCGWAMDLMSVIALYDGRPEEAALEARKGIARLPTRHPLAVRLRAKAARAHAQMGDREGCESQLGRARRAYDRLPSRAPMRFEADAGPVALYVMTGVSASASVWLGDYGKARERAQETLAVHASLPPGDRRPGREAIARCDLGIALAALGSPAEAVEQGRRALGSPTAVKSVFSRIGDLDRALTSRYPDAPDARDFHERYRQAAGRRSLPSA